MRYVDGYVLPVPKRNIKAYRRMARLGAKVFLEHGALEYRECAGDHLDVPWGVPFPKALRLKKGETVVFAWVVFRSKAHRDRVNAKVMKDPRMTCIDMKTMPFDPKRMLYGGFTTLVEG
jgi:uncharacterized protein YbaA (DUF1428 family)